MNINKEELLSELKRKYGDLENDCGCYVNNKWLSIYKIVEIIEECQEQD